MYQLELHASKDLVSLDTYLAPHVSTTTSLLSLLARPVRWGFSQLQTTLLGDSSTGERVEELRWAAVKGDWVVTGLVEVGYFLLIVSTDC